MRKRHKALPLPVSCCSDVLHLSVSAGHVQLRGAGTRVTAGRVRLGPGSKRAEAAEKMAKSSGCFTHRQSSQMEGLKDPLRHTTTHSDTSGFTLCTCAPLSPEKSRKSGLMSHFDTLSRHQTDNQTTETTYSCICE